MNIKVTHKALWTPGWYELDQSLKVGMYQRFWFFSNPPAEETPGEVDFVFFNQMSSLANSQVRYARVLVMEHSEFGPLNRVDTDGLDYIFYPMDGNEFVVNADEEPGAIYDDEDRGSKIDDWSVVVTLSDVSSPLVEAC